jgi:curved DNA-binding protein CbpA
VNLQADDFELFGLPRQFSQERSAIDARWKSLQREAHPDKFAAQGAAAQRVSMQWSVRINEAYQRLKDPLRRAAYLCELGGAPINAHSNTAASKLKDVLWLFYVSKVLDFADTFFIVVRGKWEQFSFLHIYHHFSSERSGRACARRNDDTVGAGPARSLVRSLARSSPTNSLSLLSPASLSPVFLTYWLVANAAPDGDVYYTVVANSFVHFVSEYDER